MFGSSLPKALRYNFFSIFVIQLINRNLESVQENILQKHVCEKKISFQKMLLILAALIRHQ